MSDWPIRTIAQSSYLKGRIGWQGLRAEEFLEEGPYLITGTNFIDGQIDWSACYHVSEWRFREAAYIHVKNGDLLITKDGTIGKVVLVRDCPDEAVLNSGIFLLRCKDGSYDHKFCYYVLTSETFEEFLRRNLNGSTINHLYQNVFEKFKVPVPDRGIQRKIGNILEVVDRTIEKTEALIEKYQQIKAGLMHDLFTRGIGTDGKLRLPREQAPDLYQQTPIGWIPKDWNIQTIGSFLFEIQTGKSPNCSDIPATTGEWGVLKVSSVHPNGFRSDQNKVIESMLLIEPSFEVKTGDLLMTRANTPDLVGLVCLVNNPQPKLMLCDKTLRLVVDELKASKSFIFFCMQQSYVRSQIESAATGTSMSMKNISQSAIRGIRVACPSLEEQHLIAAFLENVESKLRAEEIYLKKLIQQKSGLMHDLLIGKVMVDAEHPEAAHV